MPFVANEKDVKTALAGAVMNKPADFTNLIGNELKSRALRSLEELKPVVAETLLQQSKNDKAEKE